MHDGPMGHVGQYASTIFLIIGRSNKIIVTSVALVRTL